MSEGRAVSRAPRSRGESTRADWQGADQHRHRNAQLERARQSAPAQSRVRTAGVHPRREYVTIAWAPPRLSSAAPPNDGAFAGLSQSRRHNINLHHNYCSQAEKKSSAPARTMEDEHSKRQSSPARVPQTIQRSSSAALFESTDAKQTPSVDNSITILADVGFAQYILGGDSLRSSAPRVRAAGRHLEY